MKKTTDIRITHLIEHNERLVQMAIVAAENGDGDTVNSITFSLVAIFEKIYKLRGEKPDRYESLMSSSVSVVTPMTELFGNRDDYYNRKSFVRSYAAGFHRIWIKSLQSELQLECDAISFRVQKIIEMLMPDYSNRHLVDEFLHVLARMSYDGITKRKDSQTSLTSPTYYWYFNLAQSSVSEEKFDVKYLPLFNQYLWGALKRLVSLEAFEVFKAFVSTLFHGSTASLLSRQPIYYYFDDHLMSPSDNKDLTFLDRRLITIDEENEFDDFNREVNEIVERNVKFIIKGTSESVKEQLRLDSAKAYKKNSLEAYVFLLGAYLVFKRKYDWIKYIWEFKQPRDAGAVYGSFNTILQDDLYSVFRYLLNEQKHVSKVEFAWEDHHGVSLYYLRYGILMLSRLYLVPRIYVFQDALPNAERLIRHIETSQLDELKELCESLKRQIPFIDDTGLFKETKIKLPNSSITTVQTSVSNLLDRIIDQCSREKRSRLQLQAIGKGVVNQIAVSTNELYKRESVLVSILDGIGAIEISEEDNTEKEFQTVDFRIFRPKDIFIEQWNNLGPNVGYEPAVSLAFKMTNKIKDTLDKQVKSTIVTASDEDFLLKFKSLKLQLEAWSKPVGITFGTHLGSIFWNDPDYTPAEERSGSAKVGTYTLGAKTLEFYNVNNVGLLNYMYVFDADTIGKFKLLRVKFLSGSSTKEFVRLDFKENSQAVSPQVELNFMTYYLPQLKNEGQIIKIGVNP